MFSKWPNLVTALILFAFSSTGYRVWAEEIKGTPPAEGVPMRPAGERTVEEKDAIQMAIQMMEEVKRREKALAAREEELHRREERLKALESELSETLNKLVALEQEISESKIQQLAKVFESSPPEKGGKLLSELDPKIAARVLSLMNSRKAGRLWGYVDPKKAAVISQILAKRRKK